MRRSQISLFQPGARLFSVEFAMLTQPSLFETVSEQPPLTPISTTPTSVAQPCSSHLYLFEPGYIRHVQQRAGFSKPRQHQEVVDGRALSGPDLRRINADLMRRVGELDREAIAILVADTLGVPTHLALGVPVSRVPLQRRPVCMVNLVSGMVERNYAALFVERAAQPMSNGRGEPSTWIAHVPLVDAVWRALLALTDDSFKCGTLEELLGATFDHRRKSLDPGHGHTGRLRTTCSRRTNGMTVAAIEAGMDHFRPALILGDAAATNTARYYYTRIRHQDVYESAAAVYRACGLGEPVPTPANWPDAFGSHVVPTELVLVDAHKWCAQTLTALRPPRKYTRKQVVDFHRAYMHSAGWMLLFCIGSRPTEQADVTANKLLPGTISFRYADKATEASGESRPVLVCRTAQALALALWHHWREIERRLAKVEHRRPPSTLLQHARKVLARCPASLLTIETDDAQVKALGTHAIQEWFPEHLQIAPNAGRHFWLSHFLSKHIPTCHADVFARHARVGTEGSSSISALSSHASYVTAAATQDTELARLGLTAFVGL